MRRRFVTIYNLTCKWLINEIYVIRRERGHGVEKTEGKNGVRLKRSELQAPGKKNQLIDQMGGEVGIWSWICHVNRFQLIGLPLHRWNPLGLSAF